jgi:hypothetical protein
MGVILEKKEQQNIIFKDYFEAKQHESQGNNLGKF